VLSEESEMQVVGCNGQEQPRIATAQARERKTGELLHDPPVHR
jgi:hypothetical protein